MFQGIDLHVLVFELLLVNSLLLIHQVPLLIKDLLDSLVNAILHLLGLNSFRLLVLNNRKLITLNLFSLLFDLGLVLHVHLPEVIELLLFLVNLNFALGDLVDQLLSLVLHRGNGFDLLGVLVFENVNLDKVLSVLVSFNQESFEQDINLIRLVKLLEVGLKLCEQHVCRVIKVLEVWRGRTDRIDLKLVRHVCHERVALTLRVGQGGALIVGEDDEVAILVNQLFLVHTLVELLDALSGLLDGQVEVIRDLDLGDLVQWLDRSLDLWCARRGLVLLNGAFGLFVLALSDLSFLDLRVSIRLIVRERVVQDLLELLQLILRHVKLRLVRRLLSGLLKALLECLEVLVILKDASGLEHLDIVLDLLDVPILLPDVLLRLLQHVSELSD